MILVTAALLWLLGFILVSFAPRIDLETRRNAQSDLFALGALGILTAGFFWQVLFTANAWMPAGGGDLAGFLYPTYHFAQEWLLRGIVPLWNPYIFGGIPFVGDIQTALFYPVNLLTYLFSNPLQYRDLQYLAILHFYIAGAGMYALLRYGPLTPTGNPLNRFSCLAGAIAFAFSDVFITHFGNLNLIATAAWLPLVLLFFMRAVSAAPAPKSALAWRPGLASAIVSGIILALSFFAGHIQPYLFIVLTLALYAGYSIALARPKWKQIALKFLVTLGVGIGLTAVTLLPALELTSLSVRTAFTYQDATQFSLPPIELVGVLVPGFFGRGPQDAWGPWARVEVGYLGIFPLILALLAVILRRNSRTLFYVLLAISGMLLALGGFAILHGWLFQFVPGFGQLRAPARFVLLMDFGLAVLAAIGFDALTSPLTGAEGQTLRSFVRRGAWVALIVALVGGALALGMLALGQGQDPVLFQRIAAAANAVGFFILLLAFSFALLFVGARACLPARTWSIIALALIFLDLFSLGAYVDVGNSDPTLGYRRADVVDYLRANAGLARIDSRTDVEGMWRPDTGLLYRLQDVYGDNPLVLEDWERYWSELGGRDSSAYRFLNVKFALAQRGTPMPENFVKAFEGGGGITIWENQTAVPRAWLETNIPHTSGAIEGLGISDSTREVEITVYSPNEIVAELQSDVGGYVVFSETFVPGWRAFVNDIELAVLPANGLFRAVPIAPGKSVVRMIYDPLSFKLGALISGLTLLIVLTTFAALAIIRRRQP